MAVFRILVYLLPGNRRATKLVNQAHVLVVEELILNKPAVAAYPIQTARRLNKSACFDFHLLSFIQSRLGVAPKLLSTPVSIYGFPDRPDV